MNGHVRLVKMSWLIKWNKAGKILARRQELPEEAFISVAKLKALCGKGNKDGVLPIIAISFCWLTPDHPDPEGKQLATIAAQLERETEKYGELFSEMGVFWDWPSLYQKDAKGNRSAEEQEGFRFALHETMDLWYAHQGTTVYMLTQLPEGSTRKVGYSDSGWTTYERCSAEQIKKFYLYDARWKLVLDLGTAAGKETKRGWPIGPDDFDVLVEEKEFTNGADKDAVKELFRKMSINQLGGIKMLDFDGMSPPAVVDARQLGGCLNLCENLERLDLARVGMTDETCKAMFSSLAIGPHRRKPRPMLLHRRHQSGSRRGQASAHVAHQMNLSDQENKLAKSRGTSPRHWGARSPVAAPLPHRRRPRPMLLHRRHRSGSRRGQASAHVAHQMNLSDQENTHAKYRGMATRQWGASTPPTAPGPHRRRRWPKPLHRHRRSYFHQGQASAKAHMIHQTRLSGMENVCAKSQGMGSRQ